MDPKPDYGYDSYKGTGKLKGKVRVASATTCVYTFTRRHAHDEPGFQIQFVMQYLLLLLLPLLLCFPVHRGCHTVQLSLYVYSCVYCQSTPASRLSKLWPP